MFSNNALQFFLLRIRDGRAFSFSFELSRSEVFSKEVELSLSSSPSSTATWLDTRQFDSTAWRHCLESEKGNNFEVLKRERERKRRERDRLRERERERERENPGPVLQALGSKFASSRISCTCPHSIEVESRQLSPANWIEFKIKLKSKNQNLWEKFENFKNTAQSFNFLFSFVHTVLTTTESLSSAVCKSVFE